MKERKKKIQKRQPEDKLKLINSKNRSVDQRIADRQPMLMVVCGETGVGKTYRTVKEIRQYVSDIPSTQKKGRKVLIFDVNDDDYTHFMTIDPNHVKDFKEVRIRRIRPITRTGKMMTLNQKRQVVEKIVAEFKNGLIVLEDIDKFMVGAKGQEVVGLLCANRHSDLDIIISHQSIAKITTTEWQNMTWLRLHKQVDDISRYRSRIPNYPLVRIATFIVEEQYNLAHEDFELQLIDKEIFQIRKSFFVYLDMRRLKIRGCSKAAFIRAAKRYVDQEENKKVRLLSQERTMDDKPKYKDRKAVVIQLIKQKMRYHQAA